MGYQSKKSVENLDSMFIYLGVLFGLVVFAIAIRFFKERFKFVKIVYDYLAKLVFWNMFLRMFLEGYMEYAITSLMNIYKLKWDTRSETFSSVFSLVIFIWIFLFPMLVWFLLTRNFSKLSDQKIIDTFG